MANNVSIIIKAEDQASAAIRGVSNSLEQASGSANQQSTLVSRLSANWQTFAGISVGSGVAIAGLWGQVDHANDSAQRLQSALIGLNSIARAFHQDADAAREAAQSLAADGLMTVTDAATGLKNLLASGFSLDQAVTLMQRFKDSAAFGRQSALSFGQAVSSATEGIKNGNSILVDNAGVTKNLSVILEEAGYSAQDLMKATTDAGVRQALFAGILRETNPQVGDAARLTNSAAGEQARLAAETEKSYQQIGLALQPALLTFLQTVTPIITSVGSWVSQHQTLTSVLIVGTGVLLTLIATVGVAATAIQAAGVVAAVFGPTVAASVGIASGAFSAFAALVATPLIMPAIAIGAALASLYAIRDAAFAARDAVQEAKNAESYNAISEDAAYRSLKNTQATGSAEQEARASAALNRLYPGRAAGGPVQAGQTYWVGEHGPEPFTPSTSGTISSASSGAPSPSTVIINFYGPVTMRDDKDVKQIADRVDKTQRLAKVGMA